MAVKVSVTSPLVVCLVVLVLFHSQEGVGGAVAAAPAARPGSPAASKNPAAAAAGCGPSNLVITQSKTGNIVEGKPEYEVTVVNRCRCSQSRVTTRCYGLSSVRPVDPRAIRPVDDELCVVNRGRPVAGGGRVRFRYAWMTPQDFPVVSSQILC